nr:RNA-directed DNA polymerase, eukaryota, reverse transcriptase zinc-binding domain protein [Tanacetum cinerariifolium]GEW05150.1 RNA-directed DNA polymerase, eukaryota, reverse transcriptase zinc-binding domain protein [Tanacetum cinerariifolium]
MDSWKKAPGDLSNGVQNLVGKLKFIKLTIRDWVKESKNNRKGLSNNLKEDLRSIDENIEAGNGTNTVVTKRMEVISELQRIDKMNAMGMAQKAKKSGRYKGMKILVFFHGMLNKKRNQSNIRGVMVDGVWQEKPDVVKCEFFKHFCTRFDKPSDQLAVVEMLFSRSLSVDQQEGLEHIPRGCNSCFIALIPKITDENLVKDFRPICLIGSVYKIIVKVLTNRLVVVLGDLIHKVQSAFIADRKILDGPFILNEVLQWCKSRKKQALIFKVDFEKAYDSVRWDFLDDVLKKVVEAGLSMRMKLNQSVSLTHMFYADDAIFVGQWSNSNINTLTLVLECFYRASGLRINMNKSKIMRVHVEGTKVGRMMSRADAWEEVLNKVRTQILKWKMKALSIGGRLTLLKSVLGTIPIFHMLIFRVPLNVLHTLESIRRNFFNGHTVGSNKATWFKWDNVLADKDHGGIGVSRLYAINRSLMMKWVWRFHNQQDSLWVKVIKAIYGDDRNVDINRNFGVRSCWSFIVNELRGFKNQGVDVLGCMRLKVGNGDMVSFWNDNRLGISKAKVLFPRVLVLENCKEVNLRDKLIDSSLDRTFCRQVRGGAEQTQYEALMEMARKINLVPMGDRWIWTLQGSGDFTVASIHAIPTRLNISRHAIDIQSLTCPICDGGMESSEHLFFRCELSRQIGRKIANWWNVSYVDVESYEEWLSWMTSLKFTGKTKMLLEGIFYGLWWCIWMYRNKIVFEEKVHSKAFMFDNVVSSLFIGVNLEAKPSLQHFPFSPTTIPENPGRLVAGDDFPGRHVAREKSNGKARMGYLPGRQRRAHIF